MDNRVTRKPYFCPLCRTTYTLETNHTGEVYSRCRVCGHGVLYYGLDVGRVPDGSCILVPYIFDLHDSGQRVAYLLLCSELEAMGYDKFLTSSCRFDEWRHLQLCSGMRLSIFNKNAFEDQFITDRGRLHNWFERQVPNKYVKMGYYLKHM